MSLRHAVLLIDHAHAEVLQFNSNEMQVRKLKAHTHRTRQHGSSVRTEQEYFSQVCDALEGIPELLVAGNLQSQADFRHYLEKHRPQLVRHITGWETVDHPSEGQLMALAKVHFKRGDKLTGAARHK